MTDERAGNNKAARSTVSGDCNTQLASAVHGPSKGPGERDVGGESVVCRRVSRVNGRCCLRVHSRRDKRGFEGSQSFGMCSFPTCSNQPETWAITAPRKFVRFSLSN